MSDGTPRAVRELRAVNVDRSIFQHDQMPLSALQRPQSLPSSQDETLDRYFSKASANPTSPPVRRPVRQLPPQLASHCTVCFEESFYTQALTFLTESLSHGLDLGNPAYIPSPEQLRLIVTLAIHPALTTRTHNTDLIAGADAALKYLHGLVKMVDVDVSGLRDALLFQSERRTVDIGRGSRVRKRKPATGAASQDEEEESATTIRNQYASSKSLSSNADDFWAVVGWIFTCSVRHKARWQRWQGWLEFTLDAMHSDLEKSYATGQDLSETLIAQYLSHLGAGRGDKRRIMRAITADGKSNVFGEIWKDETKPPKKVVEKDAHDLKRPKVDYENDEYGDYLDHSDDADSQRTSRSGTVFESKAQHSELGSTHDSCSEDEEGDEIVVHHKILPTDGIEEFGGIDSIRLRQKLMAILTRFSRIAMKAGRANSLFMNTEDLFDLFTEFVRPLSLPVFQQFVLPLRPYLTDGLQISFNENLCCPLLGFDTLSEQMTQEQFETDFAPRCAIKSSTVDNAKVSLLVESLLRALWKNRLLVGDYKNLKNQVEKGIEARNQKIASATKKKSSVKSGNDQEARRALQASAERMRLLVSVVCG